MIKSYIYTEEEIKVITQKLDLLIATAAEGMFNEERNPREVCKCLHEEMRTVKDYITDGCCNFAKKSELHHHI